MKKIIITLLLILSLNFSFATSDLPFVDITISDPIYKDLKTLYDYKVIKNTSDNKFHPEALIPRDEFIGIVVGIGCKECVIPSVETIIKYENNPFFDVNKLNPYFYCISIGKDDGITQGYLLDSTGKYTCQNGKNNSETPFCPENNITRIEAATVLLRSTQLWNDELNSKITKGSDISDVDDKWYGFAKKAIEIGLIKKDSNNKIYPNEYITRREFVQMAIKIFSLNFCSNKLEKNLFSSQIKIYNKTEPNSCSPDGIESKLNTPTESVYDLFGYTESSGDYDYYWTFENLTTGEKKETTGKCLNNYDFVSNGKWIIKLLIKDKNTGKTSTSYSQIIINKTQEKNNLSVSINANPLRGESPLPVDFNSIVTGAKGNVSYFWTFGDGNSSEKSSPINNYLNEGVYTVQLRVVDENGNTGVAQLVVEVVKNIDTDKDGILDKNDLCPLVFGNKIDNGCPDIGEYIGTDVINNLCLSNLAKGRGTISGLISCNTCPCVYSIDFIASIRLCDVIFPTITNPTKNTIYSRGKIYQVK